ARRRPRRRRPRPLPPLPTRRSSDLTSTSSSRTAIWVRPARSRTTMERLTDSRRARNSASVITLRRRPASRPSRRRCFLASSRVEPLTALTSSPASRTRTTVFGGSSAEVDSSLPLLLPERRRRRRRRELEELEPPLSPSPERSELLLPLSEESSELLSPSLSES